jgi:hypothetical protein
MWVRFLSYRLAVICKCGGVIVKLVELRSLNICSMISSSDLIMTAIEISTPRHIATMYKPMIFVVGALTQS